MSLICGEGPLSLIICPSRELARQTHEILLSYSQKRLKEVLVRISIFNYLNILAEKK
jgi:superfamily II DNA/RNA helicase